MNPFWSNCVIVALKEKFNNWNNITLVPIWHGIFHFHMMWYDRAENTFRHFTHYKLDNWFTTLWFKGTVEEVKRKHLEKWCRDNCVKIKV